MTLPNLARQKRHRLGFHIMAKGASDRKEESGSWRHLRHLEPAVGNVGLKPTATSSPAMHRRISKGGSGYSLAARCQAVNNQCGQIQNCSARGLKASRRHARSAGNCVSSS